MVFDSSDPIQLSSFAALASAVAALLSVIIGLIAYKLSKAVYHSTIQPLLEINYIFGNHELMIMNVGKGPAINIRLQKSQHHLLDKKKIIEYSITSTKSISLSIGEQKTFSICPNKPIDKEDLGLVLKDLDLYRFIEGIASKKAVGLIFSNLHGMEYITHYRFSRIGENKYDINLLSIKRYGIFYKIYDLIGYNIFKMTKLPRERIFEYKETKKS